MFGKMLINKNTPGVRHRRQKYIFELFREGIKVKKKSKQKSINYKKKKLFIFNKSFSLKNILIFKSMFVVKKLVYQFKPMKQFLRLININNIDCYLPSARYLHVGKIFDQKISIFTKNEPISIWGRLLSLEIIPFYTTISNIWNSLNTKPTYTKAGGTKSLKIEVYNKQKLIYILLSSKKRIGLNYNTHAIVGKNENFFSNRFVAGKWGNSFSEKKKINVRGVAMNPIDHPNGGRSKTVQPEKSPWNWVAKKKK